MSKSEKIFSQHHGLSMACSFRDNNEEYVDVCSVQSAAAINKDVSIKFVEWVSGQRLEPYFDINEHMWVDDYGNTFTTEALFILFIEKLYDSL